jgi:cytochrome c553
MMRQLYDLKSGARAGTYSSMMKPVVADLSVDDMTHIAAYLATLAP